MGATRPGRRGDGGGYDYLQLLLGVLPQGLLKASGPVPQRLALEGQHVYLVLQGMTRRPAWSAAGTVARGSVRQRPPCRAAQGGGRLDCLSHVVRGGHVAPMLNVKGPDPGGELGGRQPDSEHLPR